MKPTTTTNDAPAAPNLKDRLESDRQAKRDALLKSAIAEGGVQALRELTPLALRVRLVPNATVDDAATYSSPSVIVEPVVHPLLDAVLRRVGATPRLGSQGGHIDHDDRGDVRVYSINVGEKANPKVLEAVLECLPPSIMYGEGQAAAAVEKGFHFHSRSNVAHGLAGVICNTPAGGHLLHHTVSTPLLAAHPTDSALKNMAVVVTVRGKQLFLKFCTSRYENGSGLYLFQDCPDLDLLRPDKINAPVKVTPDMAIDIVEAAKAEGWDILDDTGEIAQMRERMANAVLALRVPGSPGKARLVIGDHLMGTMPDTHEAVPRHARCTTNHHAELTCGQAAEITLNAAENGAQLTCIDPAVADVIAMTQAAEIGRPGLRGYQDLAVSIQVATEVGMVQASAPGLGKTVMALSGMRETALTKSAA